MGEISPSSAPRIDLLSAGDGKDSDRKRSGEPGRAKPTQHNAPPPPVEVERDDEHQLDEQA